MIRHTLFLAVPVLFAVPVHAQKCAGPKTSLKTIGKVTNPPAQSAPIDLSYSGTFKVPRTGVYHITGSVFLGMGAGAQATFTSVKVDVVGKTVLSETPPPIKSKPPNQWNWHWSIYYWQISKAWEHRVYLVKDTTYSYSVVAKGSNRVVTQYHRRNYGVSLRGSAQFCGPRAAVTPVGSGCVGTNTPTLQSPKTPVIGQRRDLVVTGRKNASGFLAFGVPATTPIYIGAGCNIYVDVALPHLLVPVSTGSTGTGFYIFTIPDDPSLSSVRVGSQAVLGNGGSPVGFDLSRSLVLTLGY